MKILHLSHSRINQGLKCGEQLRFRLQEGPEPPGIALLRGRAVDESVSANMRSKLESGEMLSVEQCDAIAADQFAKELQGEVRVDDDYGEMTFDQAKGKALDHAVSLAHLHRAAAAPNIIPAAVAVRIEIPATRIPVPLVGVLDLIAAPDGAEKAELDGPLAIRDTKTIGKKPDAEAAELSDQLSTYDLLFRAKFGRAPTDLILDQLVSPLKTISARYLPQRAPAREIVDLERVISTATRVARMVETETWLPAPEGAWWCGAKWCGYWNRCAFARGRNRPKE